MATTPNYGWVTPAPTDFVTDLPADFETFADAVDADLAGLLGGTTGQVLTKDSATDHDFSWTTISAGGMTELASGSISSGTTLSLTGISGSYKDLRFVLRNFRGAAANGLYVRFNQDSNSNRHLSQVLGTEATVAFNSTAAQASDGPNTTSNPGIVVIDFFDYANTSTWKVANAYSVDNDDSISGRGKYKFRFLAYNQTGAITSLDFVIGLIGTNWTAGDYILYGVN